MQSRRNATDSNEFFELQNVTKFYPKQIRNHNQKVSTC